MFRRILKKTLIIYSKLSTWSIILELKRSKQQIKNLILLFRSNPKNRKTMPIRGISMRQFLFRTKTRILRWQCWNKTRNFLRLRLKTTKRNQLSSFQQILYLKELQLGRNLCLLSKNKKNLKDSKWRNHLETNNLKMQWILSTVILKLNLFRSLNQKLWKEIPKFNGHKLLD